MAIPPEILSVVQPHTKSWPARLESMYAALREVDAAGVPGDVVECGVWRGGNILLARLVSPERVCWLYDTFDGMPEPDPELDVKRSGERAIDRYRLKQEGGTKWDAVSVQDVQRAFIELGVFHNTRWVVGLVEDHAPLHAHPRGIAVLRLDVDWHRPTKAALEHLYPRLSPGGFLIVDDYGHWMGARKAVDDYFGDAPPPFYDADYTCRVFKKC